jgi:hypothetical protein
MNNKRKKKEIGYQAEDHQDPFEGTPQVKNDFSEHLILRLPRVLGRRSHCLWLPVAKI